MIIDEIKKEKLPKYLTRRLIGQVFGWLISPKYLANLDSKNLGPQNKIRRCNRVLYERDSFIEWLENRGKDVVTE